MNGRERMARAMRPRERQLPDRVPVMCQLALGHYFLHATGGALDIWHDSDGFADALVDLARRYEFDGVLVNLPGREPHWRTMIVRIEERERHRVVHWKDGVVTIVPPDDNPHVVDPRTHRPVLPRFEDVCAESLHYIEPHDRRGVVDLSAFPAWHWDTIKAVRARAPELSVHGEVFSPFSQLMELVGPTEGALALALEPEKVERILRQLVAGTVALAVAQVRAGADAVLISSAYAGAGFISPTHYERFVRPVEAAVISGFREASPGVPVYTHTCGAIGDRLELMMRTGTDGIDTLDPPPLGTVELTDARQRLGPDVFIKGNVDPVNTILRGRTEACYRDARDRIAIAGAAGGYILSTACSVPPHAPPENIAALARAARDAAR
jgi:uroporphyrinogen-III decarboxylase